MELIERKQFLDVLQQKFGRVEESEGHCVFINGEAGIGKTSLVNEFCKAQKKEVRVYRGTCDALFTPRPLAPLYDIAGQMKSDVWQKVENRNDRAALFIDFLHELETPNKPTLLVIEDIHWADEATLDFIKFLARRITRIPCLFLLTYRDDEAQANTAIRHVLGQIPPDSFTRLHLTPLTRESVEKLAAEKGYSGEDLYRITGGNPFYVTEIIASYSPGIPENIKDSILAIHNRLEQKTKQVWSLLSVLPTGIEINYFNAVEAPYLSAISFCLEAKVLLINNGRISFKHELYRRTIENSLSPFCRVELNKHILELFRENFEKSGEIERIIHHAKEAYEYELVVQYAPLAARRAAAVGSHTEASKFFKSAIDFYRGTDADILIELYEGYAYECYLTNQIKEAITYTSKVLELWRAKNNIERIGDCLRFLSRLSWIDVNRGDAEKFAHEAIKLLKDRPSSAVKAMAFSNMAHMKLLFDFPAECGEWGEKAIAIAKEVNDEQTLSHVLNTVGTVEMSTAASPANGLAMLEQSLALALKNDYHDHVARTFSNLGTAWLSFKNTAAALPILEDGIRYCEERNLDRWRSNMMAIKAALYLDTGNWNEANAIAQNLIEEETELMYFTMSAIVAGTIKMRRGEDDAFSILQKGFESANNLFQLQRMVPACTAMLEYEWLTGCSVISTNDLNRIIVALDRLMFSGTKNDFAFWLYKARGQQIILSRPLEGYDLSTKARALKAASFWKKNNNRFMEALALFEGGVENKKEALTILQSLGAEATFQKLKMDMRSLGIKHIPRGIRKSTQLNPKNLTQREMEILALLKQGLQNKEIASRLFIATKTVDHHLTSIFFKLDVTSRIKAVNEAIQQGIID